MCNDLITSGRLLDYIPRFQLEFGENSCGFLLTLSENMLGLGLNLAKLKNLAR